MLHYKPTPSGEQGSGSRSYHIASFCFRRGAVFWFLLLATLLSFLLMTYLTPTTIHTIKGRVDETVSHTEEQQVLPTFSQLEEVRRQVDTGVRTMYMFLTYHLKQIAETKKGTEATRVKGVLAEAEDRLRVTQLDLANLDRLAGLSAWRDREAAALSQVLQQRLHTLQNPPNCATAKKLICKADRNAGVGSVMHDLVLCLMAAYETGRTMILHAKVKNRLGSNWEDLFLSPSPPSCRNSKLKMTNWPGTKKTKAVFYKPPFVSTSPPSLRPFAVPRDIASRLSKFSDMPGAWLVGQFVKYLMRLNPSMQRKIDTIKKELNYSHPIVAMHVRRTDKIKEAKYQPLDEYMEHVEKFYLSLDLASPSAPPTPRRVFLATELPSVVSEARLKYPKYEFLWHSNKAEELETRFTTSGFQDFVAELSLLANADYLVCTFSSNVCRLAFEWMHSLRTDASSRVVSLDREYFFTPMRQQLYHVRFPHSPSSSAWMKNVKKVKVGQQVLSNGWRNNQGGYVGISLKNSPGLLPDYKLQNIVDIVN